MVQEEGAQAHSEQEVGQAHQGVDVHRSDAQVGGREHEHGGVHGADGGGQQQCPRRRQGVQAPPQPGKEEVEQHQVAQAPRHGVAGEVELLQGHPALQQHEVEAECGHGAGSEGHWQQGDGQQQAAEVQGPYACHAPPEKRGGGEATGQYAVSVAVGHHEAAEHQEEGHAGVAPGREDALVVEEDEQCEDAPYRLQCGEGGGGTGVCGSVRRHMSMCGEPVGPGAAAGVEAHGAVVGGRHQARHDLFHYLLLARDDVEIEFVVHLHDHA